MVAADSSSAEQKFEHDIMSDSKPTVEKVSPTPSATADADEDERNVKLSTKTIMAVTAVCLIYFAQLTILVGAGSVSSSCTSYSRS